MPGEVYEIKSATQLHEQLTALQGRFTVVQWHVPTSRASVVAAERTFECVKALKL